MPVLACASAIADQIKKALKIQPAAAGNCK
jgi:hypothetical protein